MGISLFISAFSHLKFEHDWWVTSLNTREFPLEQKPKLHQVGDLIEKHTDLVKNGYMS